MSLQPQPAEIVEEIQEAMSFTQMSTEESVSEQDVSNAHNIILEGRQMDMEIEAEDCPETVISFSLLDILRKSAINLVLPFINGIMLGFGEIFAHEIGFKYGFVGARVQPARRQLLAKPKFI